jgi:hypothetical protein
MKTINLQSVLITGLLSGITILISGLTMIPVAGNEMNEILANRGLPPLSNWAIVLICVVSISNGIFLVFLYSVLKPLWVSKIKTAIISSLVIFFFTYFLSNTSLVVYGFMPLKFTIMGTVWGLGELLLAGLVAAKLYKEVEYVK